MISGHPLRRSENHRLLHEQYILGRRSKIGDAGDGRFTPVADLAELWRFRQGGWAGNTAVEKNGFMMAPIDSDDSFE